MQPRSQPHSNSSSGQPGGLNGLIFRFPEKGLGEVASSWVSTGENSPIVAHALHSVLEALDAVAGLAASAPCNRITPPACSHKSCLYAQRGHASRRSAGRS